MLLRRQKPLKNVSFIRLEFCEVNLGTLWLYLTYNVSNLIMKYFIAILPDV